MASESGSEETDFISSMRAALPEYVVNCFLAAGYDVPEVVMSMNTCEEPDNSIDLIERYIHDHYREDAKCRFNPYSDIGKPFCFPPGHRIRIRNFVCELNQKKVDVDTRACRKRKLAASENVSSCKKGRDSTYSSESESEVSITSVSEQIRVNICKWVKKQTEEHLRNLAENKDFYIAVTHVAKEPHTLSSSIRCNACQTVIQLYQKSKAIKSLPFQISNWTRHVKQCAKLRSGIHSSYQPTLPLLLSKSSSSFSSSSHDEVSVNCSTPNSQHSDSSTESVLQESDLASNQNFVNAPLLAITQEEGLMQ